MITCRICASEATESFRALVLHRHMVSYYHCPGCGYLFTERPYWLDEAYRSPINASDTGIVYRNLHLSRLTAVMLFTMYGRSGRFVDYSGGYGLLTRMMRDLGFDYYWADPRCENLFARGFEHRPGNRRPDLITCYEAFEHFVDPLVEIEKILAISRNILFTTLLLPSPVPKPEAWWYYGLNHGQHVSFYSLRTLELLASRCGLQLGTNGKNLHFLGPKRIGKARFLISLVLKNAGFASAVRLLNGSRTWEDMRKIQEDERRVMQEANSS